MCALLGGTVAGKTALGWADLTSDAVFTSRNFFGALRVREQQFDTGERYRRLQHGTTLHGLQYLAGAKTTRGDDVLHDQRAVWAWRWGRCRRWGARRASASSDSASAPWPHMAGPAMRSRSSRSTRRWWRFRPLPRRCSGISATRQPRSPSSAAMPGSAWNESAALRLRPARRGRLQQRLGARAPADARSVRAVRAAPARRSQCARRARVQPVPRTRRHRGGRWREAGFTSVEVVDDYVTTTTSAARGCCWHATRRR